MYVGYLKVNIRDVLKLPATKVGISDNHFFPFADFVIFACTTITQMLVENATQFTRLIIMYKQN